jgi:uncharacterized damage-inducible protein DinB
MSISGPLTVLQNLAEHNQWANQRLFKACFKLDLNKLNDDSHSYGSVIRIFNHLLQVEHSFFELAHGREPERMQFDDLDSLQGECSGIDQAYIEYINSINPDDLETKSFLIPWFGFEITLLEGILQPLTHSHKHRSDVSMILPLLGGEGIEMDFIQWLDEERGNV